MTNLLPKQHPQLQNSSALHVPKNLQPKIKMENLMTPPKMQSRQPEPEAVLL
jgi:hypothetical protein